MGKNDQRRAGHWDLAVFQKWNLHQNGFNDELSEDVSRGVFGKPCTKLPYKKEGVN